MYSYKTNNKRNDGSSSFFIAKMSVILCVKSNISRPPAEAQTVKGSRTVLCVVVTTSTAEQVEWYAWKSSSTQHDAPINTQKKGSCPVSLCSLFIDFVKIVKLLMKALQPIYHCLRIQFCIMYIKGLGLLYEFRWHVTFSFLGHKLNKTCRWGYLL